ncbi:aspartyl protease family protein At5g10770-like, partial [Phoenix dactylifera]|uniref:Aspartyl protease family protein At5g10770-like n=1 Tax=Phoenix dactylifera TaxID=42345 RepID=A0A8B8ZX40_PHODC
FFLNFLISGSNRTLLAVTHRHGPCSPIPSKTRPTLGEILRQDQLRVNYLQQVASHGSRETRVQESQTSVPAKLGFALGSAEYVVTVGYGTPEQNQTVDFDTGSDISWIQCQPCPACYPQQENYFNASQSSSYASIPCSSPECSLSFQHACSNSTCIYGVTYGDGSSTVGYLSRETLTLSPSDKVSGFIFGCGQSNKHFIGKLAGLMGLGRGNLSLVSQTSQKFGNVFSYCLPPTESSAGYLTFGEPAPSAAISYTPMHTDPTFYVVNLTAISVGGQQLAIQPSVFSSAMFILDSGTVITRLPPSAYQVLRSAFQSSMMNYTMRKSSGILDTCYDENVDIKPAPVALHFEGNVTLNLDDSGILFDNCLAFAGNKKDSDGGIIV